MKRILLCGESSFAASGLMEKLEMNGFIVDSFSRGGLSKDGHEIHGDVFGINNNSYLSDTYDYVINFIIIKDGLIEENLRYVRALDIFCEEKKVKRLFQISSISVYPNHASYIDEDSDIESDPERKGSYAAVKIAVDDYLLHKETSYEVTFLRPGFIISRDREVPLGGILLKFSRHIGILLGDRYTSLPLIEKERMHHAIIRILKFNNPREVYLLLENKNTSKKDFVIKYYDGFVVELPRKITLFIAKCLQRCRVINEKRFLQIKGLFKSTYFDSSETEYELGFSFSTNSIAVIGAGAYGSYIIQTLFENNNDLSVTLFDVGSEKVKDEDEIGYGTNLLNAPYTGLKKGRFFGYGGASNKWGGQLLMFTENDFQKPNDFMKGIISLNNKYRNKVFSKFGIHCSFDERRKKYGLFTKTGVWLGYFNRDLFRYFSIKKQNIFIRNNVRVSRFIMEGVENVKGIEFISRSGKVKRAYYDQYFLSAGAFESNRILLSSGMIDGNIVGFSDHLSQKIFKIKGSTLIDKDDYQFSLQGTSLITKRLIGEIDGVSFFANPIYNSDFPFFQNLKKIMFKGEIKWDVIKAIIFDIPSVFGLIRSLVLEKKIYVYKDQWYVFIDIENPSKESVITLSNEKDLWGVSKLDVDFKISPQAQLIYTKAKKIVRQYLKENNVDFEDCGDEIHVEKSEDTYHPYGMFLSDASNVKSYFNRFPNLLVVNTGVLPRAGGINTTASCFPLIEEYIANYYNKQNGCE